MDTTTSREDFEKWLKLKMPTTYKLAFEDGEEDELTKLAKASVLDMRTAWQASRASIAVELPKHCERYVWSDGAFNFKEDITEVLRSAGLTVKGD